MIGRKRAIVLSVALVVVSGVLATIRLSTSSDDKSNDGYCALLTDAIGLYVGNPITQMGFRVGTVTDVDATSGTAARVGFSLQGDRQFPADVKAVIRSTSILADRSLELVGNYVAGQSFSPGECVPLSRTATPKSISEVVGSMATFVDGISPDKSNNIADAVTGLDRLMHNRGTGIRDLLNTSAGLLDNPDQSIADIATIIDNIAQLSTALDQNTGPLKEIITALPITTPDLADAVHGTDDLIDALPPLVIPVDDLERRLGPETDIILDTTSTILRLVAARSTDIAAFLEPLPGLIGMIETSTASSGAGFALNYRPPVFRLDTGDPAQLCATLNTAMPGSCSTIAGQPQASAVSLVQLVIALAGGQS